MILLDESIALLKCEELDNFMNITDIEAYTKNKKMIKIYDGIYANETSLLITMNATVEEAKQLFERTVQKNLWKKKVFDIYLSRKGKPSVIALYGDEYMIGIDGSRQSIPNMENYMFVGTQIGSDIRNKATDIYKNYIEIRNKTIVIEAKKAIKELMKVLDNIDKDSILTKEIEYFRNIHSNILLKIFCDPIDKRELILKNKDQDIIHLTKIKEFSLYEDNEELYRVVCNVEKFYKGG